MSIASNYAISFRHSVNKELVRKHAIAKATIEKFGEDTRLYFPDGSSLIDRKIVNELQLFKG